MEKTQTLMDLRNLPQHTVEDILRRPACTDPRRYVVDDWVGNAANVLEMDNVPVKHRMWCVLHTYWLPHNFLLSVGLWALNHAEKRIDWPNADAMSKPDALTSYLTIQNRLRAERLELPFFACRERYMNEARSSSYPPKTDDFYSLRWALANLLDFESPSHLWGTVINCCNVGTGLYGATDITYDDAMTEIMKKVKVHLWAAHHPGAAIIDDPMVV